MLVRTDLRRPEEKSWLLLAVPDFEIVYCPRIGNGALVVDARHADFVIYYGNHGRFHLYDRMELYFLLDCLQSQRRIAWGGNYGWHLSIPANCLVLFKRNSREMSNEGEFIFNKEYSIQYPER